MVIPSVPLVLLSLLGLYLVHTLLEFRKAVRSLGWVSRQLQHRFDITESFTDISRDLASFSLHCQVFYSWLGAHSHLRYVL